MTSKERDARVKIYALVKWFEGRKLPKVPFKLNNWTTVHDCKQFVRVQVARLGGANIYNRELQASYLRLTELKNFIESQAK